MVSETEQFLLNENSAIKIEIDGVVAYQCNYEPAFYSDSLFSELKIQFPVHLANAVQKRKAEFLAGRFCAKKALSKLKVTNYAILADRNRCPLWPEHIKGSITHNNNLAVVAITAKPSVLGIGIDIENIISATVINDIEEEILYGNEFSLLKLADGTPEMLFSLIFSIKEAFFKAAYPSTGSFFGFDAVRITSLDFEHNRFELILCQNLNSFLKQGLLFKGYFNIFDDQVLTLMQIEEFT